MTQRTLVLVLPRSSSADLEGRLSKAGLELRPAPHARFSARGPGIVATLYDSGKLVIQGQDPEAFAARFLEPGRAVRGAAAAAPAGGAQGRATTVGSDESGKGDYFGPLVVAAVRLDAPLAERIAGGEVRDSKTMADESVLRVGGALRRAVPFAIARLDPPEYNAAHARHGNLNTLLAELHGQAIRKLCAPGMRVVVDQFAHRRLLDSALEGCQVHLEQFPRAESSELSVAAASLIAREEFLLALARLSATWAVDLAKGAGPPTDAAARRFVALHGAQKLGQVAKLHFRTTRKVTQGSSS